MNRAANAYGSVIAAPVVGAVLNEVLPTWAISLNLPPKIGRKEISVPDLVE